MMERGESRRCWANPGAEQQARLQHEDLKDIITWKRRLYVLEIGVKEILEQLFVDLCSILNADIIA